MAIIVPFAIFLYLIYFRRFKRYNTILTLILFAGSYALSGNFQMSFYRPVFQGILIWVLLDNILYLLRYRARLREAGFYMLGMLFFILLSGFNDIIPSYYKAAVINYLMILSTVFFIFRKLNTREKIYEIFYFIANLAFIEGIFGVLEAGLHGVRRLELNFSNPNYYAYFLGIGFIILLYLPKEKWKMLKIIIIALAIVLSGSRIVILSVVFAGTVYLFRKKHFIMMTPVYLFIVAGIAFLFFNFGHSRFLTKAGDRSDAERTTISIISISMAKEHPVNGIGYGQFIEKFILYLDPSIVDENIYRHFMQRDKIVTHNDFLRILAELGIFALLFLIIIILRQLYLLSTLKEGLMIFMLFSHTLLFSVAHNNTNSFMFWLFILFPLLIKKIPNWKPLPIDITRCTLQ